MITVFEKNSLDLEPITVNKISFDKIYSNHSMFN